MKSKNTPLVSIIVPIYNVEKYLPECIDSIINQTLENIEIILIDDGSPDNSGKIIDKYAKGDSRIRTVHRENKGYTASVNEGIELAKGKYIGIIESDDWIEPDMYEKLYNDASKYKTDITKGLFYFYNPTLPQNEQNKVYKNPSGIDLRYAPDGPFEPKNWPQIMGFHASIWSSIYEAKFIKKIKLHNTAGASYQDFPFMVDVLTRAQKISVVKKPFVHWRNEPKQGNSTSAKGKKLLYMPENTLEGLRILKASKKYDYFKEAFYAHALWTNIGFFYKISSNFKDEYYKKLKLIFKDLQNDKTFKYTFFRPEDKISIKTILKYDGWKTFYFSHILGGVRRRIRRIKNIFYIPKRISRLEEKISDLETKV